MNVTVYCGSTMGTDPEFQTAAIDLGLWIAKGGHTLVYGGGNIGLMGMIADTVLDNGGRVVGVIPDFLLAAEVGHVGAHTLEVVKTMSARRTRMLELGDVFIAMPGGIGTLEEITEVLSLRKLHRIQNRAIFYNINGFYDSLHLVFQEMTDKGFLPESDFAYYEFVRNLDQLRQVLES